MTPAMSCKWFLLGVIAVMLMGGCNCSHYIDDYGAIPHSDTIDAQMANSLALQKAIAAANSSSDKTVVIPKRSYYLFSVWTTNVSNLHLMVLGKLIASKSVKHWPRYPNSTSFLEFMMFVYCDNLTISGGGSIDGRGYHWWTLVLLNDKRYIDGADDRPHLMHLVRCRNTTIHDLKLKNSPFFHIKMDDCQKALIYNLDIKVNTTAQLNLLKHFSLEGVIPMFPFNTDGIDPHGTDMHIFNLTVQNWDDVVVPKPGSKGDVYGNCTENFLVENCTVRLGVGMSIGSIAPSDSVRCIRNVTFRNVEMSNPLKGIYIKTNPGNSGHSIVSNIVYENFSMQRPIWWAVYIGPQQMKEPDRGGPGCMLYPFDPKGTCSTQPLVTVQNITLRNIAIRNSVLYPVTIRCNVSNPCRWFEFDNVTTDKWSIGQKETGVVCEYVSGRQSGTHPQIPCFYDGLQEYEPEQLEPNSGTETLTAELIWREL